MVIAYVVKGYDNRTFIYEDQTVLDIINQTKKKIKAKSIMEKKYNNYYYIIQSKYNKHISYEKEQL